MRPSELNGANPDRFADTIFSVKARLDQRHLQAAHILVSELKSKLGSSGGLTGSYKERVDCSASIHQSRVKASANASRVDSIINSMRTDERALFNYLMFGQGAEPAEKIGLRSYGKKTSRYSSPDSCQAFATGVLRSMLDGVADYFIRARVMQPDLKQAA